MSDTASTAPRVAEGESEQFNTPAVAGIATAHFVHDLYPSFLGPLLPLLIDKHAMSLGVAGGLATILRWPGIAQPFLGYWADRTDARILLVITPLLTAVAIAGLGIAPGYVALVACLVVAGFSSAAFHPVSSAMITRVAGREWGRATSYYMTGGELARTAGPLIVAAVVTAFGLVNLWVAVLPAIAISAYTYVQVGRRGARVGVRPPPTGLRLAFMAQRRPILLLAAVVLFRSLVIASFQVFFPTFVVGTGATLAYAGLALAIYEAGGVVGAFTGGPLSDRFGRKTMMALSQLTAGPLLFGALLMPNEPLGLVMLALGGLLALSAGPVQLTLVQELLPNNRSAAAGIVMFLGFEGQIFATIGMGLLADVVGLQSALSWSVLASMLSLPFTLLLPETRSGAATTGH